MAKTRRVKRITAGRYVQVVVYDQVLASDTPRARRAKREYSSRARQLLNHKAAWKDLQLSMLANCSPGDFWIGLSYDDQHLPKTYEAAQANAKNYITRLRYNLRKAGIEIRYYYNTETLNKDGSIRLHHHVLIPQDKISEDVIVSLWGLGDVEIRRLRDDPMYSEDFVDLAQYMVKERFPDAPGRKPGRHGVCKSMNLKKPIVESFLIEDVMTITAPPGAKIVDQDHKDNEFGRFDYYLYFLSEAPPRAEAPTGKRRKEE